MKNYKIYNRVMGMVFGFVALVIIISFVNDDLSQLAYIGLIMMPLGVLQLGVGVHFITTFGKRSELIKAGFRIYWVLTIGYFLVLYAASRFGDVHEGFYQAYLFAVPWTIAIYQYFLVQKSYNERKVSRIKSAVS